MSRSYIIILSSLFASVVSADFSSGVVVGSIIANSDDNNPKPLYECIGQGDYLKKYIYFSENNTSTNYYAIKTPWIVLHSKKVRDRLVSYGAYIYKSNPSSRCGWAVSYDYDWDNDYVLTKGNRTELLNGWAYKATQATVSLEWFLIFSFIWFPCLMICVVLAVWPNLVELHLPAREPLTPIQIQETRESHYGNIPESPTLDQIQEAEYNRVGIKV